MYEKMSMYLTPFFQNIDKVIGKESREALVGNGTIEILPLAYCRGLSEEDCIMIFDEA
jgi:phosphate starvation-inducible protein PhoH